MQVGSSVTVQVRSSEEQTLRSGHNFVSDFLISDQHVLGNMSIFSNFTVLECEVYSWNKPSSTDSIRMGRVNLIVA